MEFENEKELLNFVNDIPYYSDKNNFCLGNTLEEAAEIIRKIVGTVPTEGSKVCGNG